MKVSELIEQLQQYDPEMIVVVDGYEGGVGELTEVKRTDIALNYNTAWYYGEHEQVSVGFLTEEEKQNHQIVTAVYFSR